MSADHGKIEMLDCLIERPAQVGMNARKVAQRAFSERWHVILMKKGAVGRLGLSWDGCLFASVYELMYYFH